MAYHKSLKSLFADMEAKANSIMANDVFDKVVEVQSEMVEKHVYDAYDPTAYSRRGRNGGLADPNNNVATFFSINGAMQMLIQNITTGSDEGTYIAGLVEYGHNNGYGKYQYPYSSTQDPNFLLPRPFISETIKHLQASGIIRQAFIEGFNKRGIRTY